MELFSGLREDEIERLAILSEEMGEAQKAIGKILRHGYESCNPTLPKEQQMSNRSDMERKLGDVMYAFRLMADSGDIDAEFVYQCADAKARKIKPYLHHQGE